MLLLDQGLPRSTILHLRDAGLKADHVGEVGLAAAADSTILARARDHAQIVVTLEPEEYSSGSLDLHCF
jgi:predicted nuclease of predicted toxin-antitoxin system